MQETFEPQEEVCRGKGGGNRGEREKEQDGGRSRLSDYPAQDSKNGTGPLTNKVQFTDFTSDGESKHNKAQQCGTTILKQ